MARALRHYLAAWGLRRVVLVGYSRGADVVPTIAAGLPSDLRERLRLLALIAPGKKAEFEVHVTDIFGGEGRPTHPVLPDIQALGSTPVLCLYGDEEQSDSLCPDLSTVPGAYPVMLKGGTTSTGTTRASRVRSFRHSQLQRVKVGALRYRAQPEMWH